MIEDQLDDTLPGAWLIVFFYNTVHTLLHFCTKILRAFPLLL